jgi:hypothetical protein
MPIILVAQQHADVYKLVLATVVTDRRVLVCRHKPVAVLRVHGRHGMLSPTARQFVETELSIQLGRVMAVLLVASVATQNPIFVLPVASRSGRVGRQLVRVAPLAVMVLSCRRVIALVVRELVRVNVSSLLNARLALPKRGLPGPVWKHAVLLVVTASRSKLVFVQAVLVIALVSMCR